MKKVLTIIVSILLTSCNNSQVQNHNTDTTIKNKVMTSDNSQETVDSVLTRLNWWMKQIHDEQGNEIESTGEAQGAIHKYLQKLDSLGVKYQLKDGQYYIVK